MNEPITTNNICEYNDYCGAETKNPLVSVIDFSKLPPMRHTRKLYSFYAVFLKDVRCGELRYGRQYYDYQEGTLVFVAPGQVFGIEDDGSTFQPAGYALLFHPDLLRGTHLAGSMRNYTFFSYEVNEALHLSLDERKIIIDCLHKIDYEISRPIDKFTKELTTDSIKTFLDYCARFYSRQFLTRDNENKDILLRFEKMLNDYFNSDLAHNQGLPSVQRCAEKLCLSPNYFSDLLKKETGQTALKYIHDKVLDLAKTKLVSTNATISEISASLGFEYAQHFTRLFKSKVGCSPTDYREQYTA